MGANRAQLIEAEVLEIESAPLVDEGIEGLFRRLRKRANISYDPDTERPASPHSLRKYLHSALDAAGVNSTMVNTIIGHSNAIAEHYSGRKHLDIEEIRHAYESDMQRIAVTEESNGAHSKKVEAELKAALHILSEERVAEKLDTQNQINDLKQQLAGYQTEFVRRVRLEERERALREFLGIKGS